MKSCPPCASHEVLYLPHLLILLFYVCTEILLCIKCHLSWVQEITTVSGNLYIFPDKVYGM